MLQDALLVQPQNPLLPDLSVLGMDAPPRSADAQPLAVLGPDRAAVLLERAREAEVGGALGAQAASSSREAVRSSLAAEQDALAERWRGLMSGQDGYLSSIPRGGPIAEVFWKRDEVESRLDGRSTPRHPSAMRMLAKANWLLQDLSPQDLADRPLEELNGLAAVLLDSDLDAGRDRPLHLRPFVHPTLPADAAELRDFLGAGKSSLAELTRGLALLSQTRAGQTLGARGIWRRKTRLEGTGLYGEPTRYFMDRAPLSLRTRHEAVPSASPEDMHPTVFRHYTRPDLLPEILQFGRLRQGQAPYVSYGNPLHRLVKWMFGTPMVHHVYRALTGVFLTLPGVEPESVGVEREPHGAQLGFVDLLVPRRLPVLRVERNIFFIPLPPLLRNDGWGYYGLRYGASAANWIRERFREIPQFRWLSEIHPETPIEVPVRLLSHGVAPARDSSRGF